MFIHSITTLPGAYYSPNAAALLSSTPMDGSIPAAAASGTTAELTAAATWINSFFSGFDNNILEFMHKLAESAGSVLTPLAKFITLIGEKGLIMFLLAFVFLCFSRTRKLGLCMFGAVCCGALITNIILKDLIARPRPFEAMASFSRYWVALGSPAEDGFSFPSGHVTAAAAGMGAVCFVRGKKWLVPSAVYIFLMCFSRNYLMAHFPSDVLAASIVGLFSAFVAYLIANFIFTYMEDNDDLPLFGTLLYFDLPLPKSAAILKFINQFPLAPAGKKSEKKTRSTSSRASHASPRSKSSPKSADVDLPMEDRSSANRAGKASSHARHAKPADSRRAVPARASFFQSAVSSLSSKKEGKKQAAGDRKRRGKSTSPIDAAPAPDLDFNFEPAPEPVNRNSSDWNSRWEQYRQKKEQSQIKTAPAAPGSSQSEFERIFTPADDDVKVYPAKNKPVSREELDKTLDFLNNSGLLDIPDDVFDSAAQDELPAADAFPDPTPPAVFQPPSRRTPDFLQAEPPQPSHGSGSLDLDLDEIYALIGEEPPVR